MSEPTRDDVREIVLEAINLMVEPGERTTGQIADAVLSALAARGLDPVELREALVVSDRALDFTLLADGNFHGMVRAALAKWEGRT